MRIPVAAACAGLAFGLTSPSRRGLALAPADGDAGYLVVSSQGDNGPGTQNSEYAAWGDVLKALGR